MQALHMARLANLEGAICALLREATQAEDPNDTPDGLNVRVYVDAGQSVIDLEYTRGGIPVAGESL
jgi:hypothetical protein